jgi:FHA domain-containing protein/uncharacterized protein DUF1707
MRASDDRRERTVAALRDRALDGCLTLDTFADRVDAAYHARTVEELDRLVEDLPQPHARLAAIGAMLRRAFQGMAAPFDSEAPALQIEVRLPQNADSVTVGRSGLCDVVVGESTVSRFHAELRHGDGAWTVRDLNSTNGTWLNGMRVREAPVSGGDVLRLGGLRLDLWL